MNDSDQLKLAVEAEAWATFAVLFDLRPMRRSQVKHAVPDHPRAPLENPDRR